MNKVFLSAASVATLALAGTFLLARPAMAAEPKAKFAKMKKAVMASAKHVANVDIRFGGGPISTGDGGWVVINDQLVDIEDGASFEFVVSQGDQEIVISSADDLDQIPPEMRSKVKQAMKKAKDSGANSSSQIVTKGSLDDNTVEAGHVRDMLKKHGVDLKLDLNEKNYKSIDFGNSQNTLVLTPMKVKGQRFVVNLDPKSNLPKNIVLQQLKDGKWGSTKNLPVSLGAWKTIRD